VTDAPTEREDGGAWAKLRRRKVVQWGLAYAAAAWTLLQVIEYLGETYSWPPAIRQIAVPTLTLGSLVALVLAWYHGDRGQQRVSGAELAILSVLLALGGGALWLYGQRNGQAPATSAPPAAPTAAQGSSVASDGERPSIAVLPFENRSDEHKDAFFVDGIHDDILMQLSKVSALKVISRTSVEQFRDTKLPTKAIAEQLGVKSILEGAVQRAGDRVRINVQLIDAGTDAHLWAESYDRELTAANIFAIQSEVAAAIAAALKATLTASEKARVSAVPTQNLEAWENYQLGRQRLAKRTSTGFTEAERYFQQAIALDPNFALAYSGLADTLSMNLSYTDAPRAVTLERAQAAVDAALKHDPGLADAWASAALIADQSEHYDRAQELYRRAIDLNPSHAMALKWYGQCLVALGSIDEGVMYLERAAGVDPLSAIIQVNLGEALVAQERVEDAARRYRRAIEIDPLMPGSYLSLARLAAFAMGDFVRAVPLAEKAVALDPFRPVYTVSVAWLYWDLGDVASFDRVVRQAEERWPDNAGPYLFAFRDLQGGDRDGAERHARRALEADPRAYDEADLDALGLLGVIDYRQGRYAESVVRYRKAYPELFSAAPRIDAKNFFTAIDVIPALQKLGKTDEALALLAGSEKVMAKLPLLGVGTGWRGRAPHDARALALRGRKQEALTALRAAERAGWRWGWRFHRDLDPAFDSIRDEPEFRAIFADIERDMARQRTELAKRPKDAPLDLGVGE
jgi:TolB-like protein/Tfp pilus assembly protein PilF